MRCDVYRDMRRPVLRILRATSLPLLALVGLHCGSSDEASGPIGPALTDASVSSDGETDEGAVPDAGGDETTSQDAAADTGIDGGSGDAGLDGAEPDGDTDATTADGASDDGASGEDGAGGDDSAGADDAAQVDGGDGGSTVPAAQVCENHAWQQAVPAAGTSMMAYGSKAYLFAQDGATWAIIENQSAVSQAIPFPAGVTEMRSVTAEIAPSGRPFVMFSSGNQRYAAFFDGQAFVGTTLLGQATSAHAQDAGGPAPLPTCNGTSISTAVNPSQYGTYDPGPLMLQDERAFVFLEGSDMWMTASQGSATTGFVPAALSGASRLSAWRSVSGWNGVSFEKSSKVWATTFQGAGFSTPVETPCNSGGYACELRVAGDGHVWVYFGGNFYEQAGTTFQNRGGGPTSPSLWDVDAQGTVIVLGAGDSGAGEVLAEWKLAPGAGGWSKAGALRDSDIAGIAPSIEGGFQFGSNGLGTLAPDGSIHLFSDAHCVGNGDHNKAQAYLRSHDGVSWDVQLLPSADDLTDGLVTWRDVAFWAADYERVRYVVMSSPAPLFDGYSWTYPDRRYDVIARCDAGAGQTTFTRIARAPHPGWTVRGFAGFSDWGTATLLTQSGLWQVR